MPKTFIIAEAGINHGGSFEKALRFVALAKMVHADAVKFQTVNPDLIYSRNDPLYDVFSQARLTNKEWEKLKKYTESCDLEFISTPGEKQSADFLNQLGVKRFKIASDSAKDLDFIRYIFNFGKPTIISLGTMQNIAELDIYLKKYFELPHKDSLQAVMHCVSKYPPLMSEAKLNRLIHLKFFYDCILRQDKSVVVKHDLQIGYSDHLPVIESAVAAVALGAQIIEKHIKIDDDEIDAAVSLCPYDFLEMVKQIRNVEEMLCI